MEKSSIDGIAAYVLLREDRWVDENLVDPAETLVKGTLSYDIPIITEKEKAEF